MTQFAKPPLIAVTMGDPAGVGPELCLKLAANAEVQGTCRLALYGDAGVFSMVAEQLNLPIPAAIISADDVASFTEADEGCCIVDHQAVDAADVAPGVVGAATGRACYTYIVSAIDAAMRGDVQAVSTGPIHKEALRAAGVNHPGHTEIFGERTGADSWCMMLTSDEITCAFVTAHVGYRDVPGLLTSEKIVETGRLAAAALHRLRGRSQKLLACGLNPHAGEQGLFGNREEERIIVPALEQLRTEGIDVAGPLPPDTCFLPERRREFDCFLCMYHDQGHIPLKALAFDTAVNVTLGLPIIRTSVDHGTALDIAWQGVASVSSFVQAALLAARLAAGR